MDTDFRMMAYLLHYPGIQVYPFEEFVSRNPHFYLYVATGQGYMVPALLDREARLVYLGRKSGGDLYEVDE